MNCDKANVKSEDTHKDHESKKLLDYSSIILKEENNVKKLYQGCF